MLQLASSHLTLVFVKGCSPTNHHQHQQQHHHPHPRAVCGQLAEMRWSRTAGAAQAESSLAGRTTLHCARYYTCHGNTRYITGKYKIYDREIQGISHVISKTPGNSKMHHITHIPNKVQYINPQKDKICERKKTS